MYFPKILKLKPETSIYTILEEHVLVNILRRQEISFVRVAFRNYEKHQEGLRAAFGFFFANSEQIKHVFAQTAKLRIHFY